MKKFLFIILLLLSSLFSSAQCEWKAKLQDDLYQSKELSQAFFENGDLVDSWKVITNGKVSLRNLENVKSIDLFKQSNPDITYDAIKNAFESIKSSGTRRQAFINALKSCANNDKLIGSLQKTRLATVEEIKDALNKMRSYKTGKSLSGNLGYIEADIPNIKLEDKMWKSVSEDIARKETHIFEAIKATGSSGTWLRITDSEYRMLNDLAKKLGAVKGEKYTKVEGNLKIISENPYCMSCQGVIQQFSDMFPNIKITLIDGVK
ncbi:hypothetical protein ACIVBQ_002732 [Tenacibaculum discolor]